MLMPYFINLSAAVHKYNMVTENQRVKQKNESLRQYRGHAYPPESWRQDKTRPDQGDG